MSIKEEYVEHLRPKNVDWQNDETWNTDEWFPLPGDAVGTIEDFEETYGIVVFSPHDYKSDKVMVLWSATRTLAESIESKMARQIQEQIDAEIIQDLIAANNA